MKPYYITFRSVTYAQRALRILEQSGVSCTLQRTPKWMEEKGCGYALRIWTGEILKAVRLLQQSQIPMRRIYRQGEDAALEEVHL